MLQRTCDGPGISIEKGVQGDVLGAGLAHILLLMGGSTGGSGKTSLVVGAFSEGRGGGRG